MSKRGLWLLIVALAVIGCDAGRRLSPEDKEDTTALATRVGSGADLTVSPYYFGMSLSWADSHNETSFRVMRSTNGANGTFVPIATTLQNVTSYNDTAVASETAYCYRIDAVQKSRFAGTTSTICATSLAFTPAAASNVAATTPCCWTTRVTWTDNSTTESGFRVEIASSTTGPWTSAGTVAASVTAFNGPPLAVEALTCFRVVAFNAYANGAASNTSCVGIPNDPSNLTAVAVNGSTVRLTWSDNSALETAYQVYRWSRTNGTPEVVGQLPANTTSYDDVGLPDNTYMYRVWALNGQTSGNSNLATVMVATHPPETPRSVSASPSGSNSVTFQWFADWTNEQGYRIERSTDGQLTWQTLANLVDRNADGVMADNGVTPEQSVCYRVIAWNAFGESPASLVACTAAPLAPSGAVATTADWSTVQIDWTDNSSVEDGYAVLSYYYDYDGSVYLYELARLPANTTSVLTSYAYPLYLAATKDGGYSDFVYVDVTSIAGSSAVASAKVAASRAPAQPPAEAVRRLIQRMRSRAGTPNAAPRGKRK